MILMANQINGLRDKTNNPLYYLEPARGALPLIVVPHLKLELLPWAGFLPCKSPSDRMERGGRLGRSGLRSVERNERQGHDEID